MSDEQRCVCGHLGQDHSDDGMSLPCALCGCDHYNEQMHIGGPILTVGEVEHADD